MKIQHKILVAVIDFIISYFLKGGVGGVEVKNVKAEM